MQIYHCDYVILMTSSYYLAAYITLDIISTWHHYAYINNFITTHVVTTRKVTQKLVHQMGLNLH